MLSAKTFRYEVRDHIATITLDRPDTLNSPDVCGLSRADGSVSGAAR